MKRKYRIYKDRYGFTVQEYVPQKTFLWIFVTQQEEWTSHAAYTTEADAMAALRRAQKYGNVCVIYQDDVDELDLGTALE